VLSYEGTQSDVKMATDVMAQGDVLSKQGPDEDFLSVADEVWLSLVVCLQWLYFMWTMLKGQPGVKQIFVDVLALVVLPFLFLHYGLDIFNWH